MAAFDTVVGRATTDVASHTFLNLSVGGLGMLRQQGGGAQDLAALAVPALGDIKVDPCLLQRVQLVAFR